jgi:hypothetical protein
MKNDRAPHILNASSNLLGICFVVLTSLKFFKVSARTLVDEGITLAIVCFMLSCILSFLCIRGDIKSGDRYENIADFLFLGGLSVLFIIALLFVFNVIA